MEKQHGQHPPLIKRVDWDAATCSNNAIGWERGVIQKERSVLLQCYAMFARGVLSQVFAAGNVGERNDHNNKQTLKLV